MQDPLLKMFKATSKHCVDAPDSSGTRSTSKVFLGKTSKGRSSLFTPSLKQNQSPARWDL